MKWNGTLITEQWFWLNTRSGCWVMIIQQSSSKNPPTFPCWPVNFQNIIQQGHSKFGENRWCVQCVKIMSSLKDVMWECQNKAVTHTHCSIWSNTPRGTLTNRWEAAPEPLRLHRKHHASVTHMHWNHQGFIVGGRLDTCWSRLPFYWRWSLWASCLPWLIYTYSNILTDKHATPWFHPLQLSGCVLLINMNPFQQLAEISIFIGVLY